jgi:flagellar motor switch protein FliG
MVMSKQEEQHAAPSAGSGFFKKIDREKGYKKAAEFLILLGKDEAAKVLAQLSPEEIENISKEIASIDTIKSDEAKKVMREFGYVIEKQARGDLPLAGGMEKAKEMLRAAFGEKKAEEVAAKIGRQDTDAQFSFLKDIDAEQIAELVKEESPPVLAVIMSHIEPRLAASVLAKLPDDMKKEIAARIAHMDKISPEIVQKTADAIKKKLYLTGDITSQRVDGKSVLMNILKNMALDQDKIILDNISDDNPELAAELSERLFTMDALFSIPRRQLQLLFRAFNDKQIALLLKGKPEDLKALVLDSVSAHRRTMIMEEYRYLGQILKSDVDAATHEFLSFLRSKIESGEVVVLADGDKIIE